MGAARRGGQAAGGEPAAAGFPEGGLYWLLSGDEAYGEQQGPVYEGEMAALLRFEPFWEESSPAALALLVYHDGLDGWLPWRDVRHAIGC
jgi:hypothetical protein